MVDWTVVIGINEYPTGRISLKGAVRDAPNMLEWLLDPAGGGVRKRNVLAALSPLEGQEVAIAAPEATRDNLTDLILKLIQRSGVETREDGRFDGDRKFHRRIVDRMRPRRPSKLFSSRQGLRESASSDP